MRRINWLLALSAALFFGLSIGAAQAEVNVLVDVNKDKDVFVDEDVDIDKDVFIEVQVFETPDSVAEQGVYKNQDNTDNDVDVFDSNADATIDGAVMSANGVVLINQAPGYANNQGNEIGLSYGLGKGDTFAHAQTSVEQFNDENDLDDSSNTNNDTISNGAFSMDGSGVTGVNQSAGNQNNQNNALAMSIADNAIISLGETDLGQENTFNDVESDLVNRTDTINTMAFNGYDGVAMVNQSSGSTNNQANAVNIAADLDLNTLTAFSPTGP